MTDLDGRAIRNLIHASGSVKESQDELSHWFKPEEFPAETSCLLNWKLLVTRAVRGAAGLVERNQFRHDRVWDFFIAAAFSADPNLWAEHIEDPRFRGAYLRIAETWEPAHANQVRDTLIVKAAEKGDHTTSDEFIKRLEARRRAKRPSLHATKSVQNS